jgi:hypothetical protein
MSLIQTSACVLLPVFFATGILLIPLEIQVKRRMRAADLPVKRFASFFDRYHMRELYRERASARGWPVWPYYVHMVLILQFIPNFLLVLMLGKP